MNSNKKLRSNQVEIDGKIYTKNVTAFLVDEVYYPKSSLQFDTYRKTYNLPKYLTPYYHPINNKVCFSSNIVNIFIYDDRSVKCCRSFVENNEEFIEHPMNYFDSYVSKFSKIRIFTKKYHPESKIYSISNYDKSNFPVFKNIENKLSWIDYTYGFELETCSGRISESISNKLGFAHLYDGSINGVEYVSDVFKTHNFHYLYEFLKTCKVATDIDRFCSLHIHIGNVEKSSNNLLSMYVLFQRLTDELNQLIIPYKKDLRFLSEKLSTNGRDHCKNLPKLIKNDVTEIYKLFKINNLSHSSDSLNNYINSVNKWNISGRYYNVNFMNYICKNNNSNTIEIRSLQSTYSFDYIITWLLINTSIINYAINNYDKILNSKEKIELFDCLEYYIKDEDILRILKKNINSLKNYFYNSYYHEDDSLTNLSEIDSYINQEIISYDIFNNNEFRVDHENSLYKSMLTNHLKMKFNE